MTARRQRGRARPPVMLAGSPVERLRPRSTGRLLDGGFEVLRFRPGQIVAVLGVTWLPVYVLTRFIGDPGRIMSWVWTEVWHGLSKRSRYDHWIGPAFPKWAILGSLVMLLCEMLTGIGVAFLVTSWVRGADPTSRQTLQQIWRRIPAATLTWLMALVVKIASFALFGIGLMMTAPMLAVLAPVVASEQHRPVASLRRCFELTRTSRNMVQGLYLLPPIIGLVINSSVHLADQSGLLPIPLLTSVLAALLVAALTAWRAAVWALTYANTRVATEGLDLRLEMARVMP